MYTDEIHSRKNAIAVTASAKSPLDHVVGHAALGRACHKYETFGITHGCHATLCHEEGTDLLRLD